MDDRSLSIVLPTFNRLEYLRPALDSVFAQTWTAWDLVIADDGSSEAVRAHLDGLVGRPRTKIVFLAHSGNPAAVRNAALREATGAYVAFLDSDDLWAPRKLELQMAALRSRPDCQWSYTAFRRVDRAGQPLDEERNRPWHPHQGDIFGQLVVGAASIRTPSVIASRQLVIEVGGFDESLPSAEDYDLWMRLALRSPVAVVDEPLVDVRLHDRNHSRDWAIAYHGRDRSLAKLRTIVAPRLRALLRHERARNGLGLVAEYARRGQRQQAFAALLASAGYSWRYPEWWWRAPRAIVKSYLMNNPRP